MATKGELKNKGLLNLYWYGLIAFGILSLINTLTYTEATYKTAQIFNIISVCATILIFFGGYVDFRNFKPLSDSLEILYIITGVISLGISFMYFNVENYNALLNYDTDLNFSYSPIISTIMAYVAAVCFIGIVLIMFNSDNEKKQSKLFYTVAFITVISNVLLIIFNFGTNIALFMNVKSLFNFSRTLIIDTSMFILIATAIYRVFNLIANAKKNKTSDTKNIIILSIAVIFIFILILTVLPKLKDNAMLNTNVDHSAFIVYKIFGTIINACLLISGIFMMIKSKKNVLYGQMLKKTGVELIIIACIYLIADNFPITYIVLKHSQFNAIAATEIFLGIVKTIGLLSYTIYLLIVNNKIKNQ